MVCPWSQKSLTLAFKQAVCLRAEKEIARDVTEKRLLHRVLSRHRAQIDFEHGPTSSSSVSWSRDRHPRCNAANVPEGEKHDRDPTSAIHDGSPLAPLGDGGVDFPPFPHHQVPTIQMLQRRSRLLKSSSLVGESIPRERHGPPRETGPEDPQGCCRESETSVDQPKKSGRPLRRHMGRVHRDTSRSPG